MSIPIQEGPAAATDEHHSLKRVLTGVTNGVITFAGVGVFGGLMSLYGFSFSSAGPAMFWGWPLTLVAVGALVLVFAQLASHFPFAGSIYQWPMALAGRRVGWAIGWLYACALFPLMTAYYASLPVVLSPIFGWSSSFTVNRNIIIVAMLFALFWNTLKVGFLARLARWGMVFELTVVIGLILIVFAIGPKDLGALGHMSHVVTSASGNASVQGLSFGSWVPALLGGGIFVSYWVLYTFENGGTLGEETVDAARNAPRGILGAFGFVGICGLLFLGLLTASLAHPDASMLSGTPAQNAITLHLPGWVAKLFLIAVSEGLLLATSTMFAGATRHIFGMARDRQIPFGKVWTLTTRSGAPWAASLLVAVLSMVPVLIFTTNTAAIVGGATAAMYVAYFLVAVVALWAAVRGWPGKDSAGARAHFGLGRWNVPVTLIAVLGTGATMVNLLWPRAATNPDFDQITGVVTGNVFRHIPMGWYLVGVPVIVGVVYYLGWQRRRHAQLFQETAVLAERKLQESASSMESEGA